MTKGLLLSLDTPEMIKRKFGVGYKLMIEPKLLNFTSEGFIAMK